MAVRIPDENLKQFATPLQWQYYVKSCELGSNKKAAEALGRDRRSIDRSIKSLMRKAQVHNYEEYGDPTQVVESPHYLKGKSDLERLKHRDDPTPGPLLSWTKTDIDKQAANEASLQAIELACEGIKPLKPVPTPKDTLRDLATLYTITDFHLGMYAWGEETGDDWDVRIAEQVLLNAVGEMADGSPKSETGIFCQMGDFLHWDGLDAVTPASKHVVDADTRYDLLCDLAIQLSVSVIDLLLRKHKKLVIYICEGNHDEAGSAWLRKCIKHLYAKHKRVIIDDTAFPFYAYLHGETFLGFHHGHKVTNKNLPALFSSEPRYRPLWGQATRSYIHSGHYHRNEQDKSEGGGAIVERHNTLAARDAYASRGGWISERRAQAITYHKTKGERSRVIVTPELRR